MQHDSFLHRFAVLTILAWLATVPGGYLLAATDQSVAIPPPTVADVLTQVRRAVLDPAALEIARHVLTSEVPAGTSKEDEIDFLVKRALAADELGDLPRRLADLKRIAELAKGARNEAQQLYNLGQAEVVYGDVPTGLAALHQAAELLNKQIQNPILEANVLSLLAVVHVELGMHDDADKWLAQAKSLLERIKARPGGYWGFIPSLEMLNSWAQGRLLIVRGKWSEAETALRYAVEKSEESARNVDKLTAMASNPSLQSNMLAGRNLVVADLASHLMRMGRLDEAELLLRNILTVNLQRVGRNSIRTAVTLIQFSEVIAARGRFQESLLMLDEAATIARAIGVGTANRIAMSQHRNRVNALLGLERWSNVMTIVDTFYSRRGDRKDWGRLDIFTAGVGLAMVRAGRANNARGQLTSYISELAAVMGKDHYQVGEARGVLAMALASEGQREAALTEFAAAAHVLIDRATRDDEAQSRGLRTILRREILEAYLDLLAKSREMPDAADRAFRVADALQFGKTQQALAQSAARAAANQPRLGELIRADQDGQAEQVALYGNLLRLAALPPEKQLPMVMAGMRKRIETIDRERGERQDIIAKRFPAYANLINPKPSSIADARVVLRPGEALVSLLSTRQATYVWAFKADGPIAFVRSDMDRERIAAIVRTLRKAVDPGEVNIASGLPVFDLESAHRLYAELYLPVASVWKGADSLLVVANAALAQLPPALLPTARMSLIRDENVRYAAYRGIPWLIRDVAVTQLPSVNSLIALRKLPVGNVQRRNFVGFGDPAFATTASGAATHRGLRNLAVAQFAAGQTVLAAADGGQPANWTPYDSIPPLPDTREEILDLARVLKADKEADVFLGQDASKVSLMRQNLSNTRILAFATHGLLPGEFPGVDQPALALANPGRGQHGLLTLDEIMGLKLNADWVILSACNTAAGDGTGAEAVSGLGRGFFYAGTRSLLATHWPVESVSARLLVTGVFRHQETTPTLSRAQALRRSILSLMEENAPQGGFAYAHPLFWAPYALIGDGGR